MKKLEHCPLCNRFGTDVTFAFWCTNSECQNYKKSWDNSSEYKKCDCDEDCPDKGNCPDGKNCPKISSQRSGGCSFDKQLIDSLDDAWDALTGGD